MHFSPEPTRTSSGSPAISSPTALESPWPVAYQVPWITFEPDFAFLTRCRPLTSPLGCYQEDYGISGDLALVPSEFSLGLESSEQCVDSSGQRCQWASPARSKESNASRRPSMGYEEEDAVNNFRAMSPPRRPVLTGVDILMQTLEGPPASSTNDDSPPSSRSGKVKQHLCPFQHCNKAFAQPSQLKIHVRSHTGEKPFQCHVLGCGAAFSQLGNLRTHEGRHREEKPRRQSQPQSSSTSVHSTRRYACKLDGCKEAGDGHGKAFSQLGNLKMHMNKFHRETIARLSRVFNDRDRSRTQQELELTNYFKSLYRNCNRGLRTKAEE